MALMLSDMPRPFRPWSINPTHLRRPSCRVASQSIVETVNALRAAGKRTFFVTNNSSKSRRQYCIKLDGFGVRGVGVEDIVTSGSAIAGESAKRDYRLTDT